MSARNPLCACCGLRLIERGPCCGFCAGLGTYTGPADAVAPSLDAWSQAFNSECRTASLVAFRPMTYADWLERLQTAYRRAVVLEETR